MKTIHYNWLALRDLAHLKGKQPIWTDERYCEELGIDPSLAHTPALKEVFVEGNEDVKPEEAAEFYDTLLARNGLLNIKEY